MKWVAQSSWRFVAALLGAGLAPLGVSAAEEKPVPKAAPMKTDRDQLQGTWVVTGLETQGMKLAGDTVRSSKIIVKGTDFTTVSMGAVYRGTFAVNSAANPKVIDLHFTEGPEKGNTALGIYQLDGDTWKICLTVTAKERPKQFAAPTGSGLARETLKREPANADPPRKEPASRQDKSDAARAERAKLEGEWSMVSGEIDGQPMPEAFVKTGKRVARGDETTVTVGGRVFLKATFTIDATQKPKTIDYTMTDGPSKGKKQLGIYEVSGDTVRFCFGSPGKDRPTDFTAKPGEGRTLSVWKRTKP